MIITPMTTSVPLPICSIGDEVKYSDTAENRILEIFTTVSDLSDGSDELAAEIDDWPTRYHCSPHRSNLLRPFRISPGTRVLEIGAGSGALTRYLGECGATVTAIEGARSRAEAAAMRCHDLKTVEILCGDFKHFVPEDPFDLGASQLVHVQDPATRDDGREELGLVGRDQHEARSGRGLLQALEQGVLRRLAQGARRVDHEHAQPVLDGSQRQLVEHLPHLVDPDRGPIGRTKDDVVAADLLADLSTMLAGAAGAGPFPRPDATRSLGELLGKQRASDTPWAAEQQRAAGQATSLDGTLQRPLDACVPDGTWEPVLGHWEAIYTGTGQTPSRFSSGGARAGIAGRLA